MANRVLVAPGNETSGVSTMPRHKYTYNPTREQSEYYDYTGDTINYVYFIRSQKTGLIKIGTSGDVNERITNIAFVNKTRIDFLAAIEGSYTLERKLHRRFDKSRVEGEWFNPSNELMEYIESCPLHKIPRQVFDTPFTYKSQYITTLDAEKINIIANALGIDRADIACMGVMVTRRYK